MSRKGTSSLAGRLKKQDLIYSIGLMDYLEDKHVQQVSILSWLVKPSHTLFMYESYNALVFCPKSQNEILLCRENTLRIYGPPFVSHHASACIHVYPTQTSDWAFEMLRPGGMLVLGNFVEDPTSWVSRGKSKEAKD